MKLTRSTYRLATAALVVHAALSMFVPGALDTRADTEGPGQAVLLEVDGPIGPATSDFIIRGIDDAEEAGAALAILRLNTPGGLDSAMRDIIRSILASGVPVATYVSPPGSRAASAGTYIMYASHVAAMAPATNLGSATPVSIAPGGLGGRKPPGEPGDRSAGDPGAKEAPEQDSGEPKNAPPPPASAMEAKVINDAVAYIKGLARLRGRNEEWAAKAVRSAVNLTAEDALAMNVIDVLARDVPDLLEQLDDREVTVDDQSVRLATADLAVVTVEPDWRTRVLSVITNPNVAYMLLLAGIYGLFFELSNPGALFPGVLGAICLVLALYAFQVLPVNYAGLALILLGIAFMVAELFMPSFGIMGIGGAVAFFTGSLILIETEVEAYQISLPVIGTITAITVLFIFTVISLAVRQRSQPIVSGREQMIGDTGEALVDFEDGAGKIHIHGERWAARAEAPVRRGQKVKVRELDNLTLIVEPLEDQR